MKVLTKAQEIEILRDALVKLGADSYCGAWLADQLPSIALALASDYPVEIHVMSINEACIHCEKLLSYAKREIATMERVSFAAQAKARDASDKELARKVAGFRDSLRECLASL